jgi:HlyD family secretion protein
LVESLLGRGIFEETMKKLFLILLVGAGGALGSWQWQQRGKSTVKYNFAEIKRGRLEATIGSTGTLRPRETVEVGARISGRIIALGKDPNTKSGIVDWGSEVEGPVVSSDGKVVKSGTVLARIDPAPYEAQRDSARAAVKAAEADVLVKTARLDQAARDWGRVEKLYHSNVATQAEHDQYKTVYEAARANLELSKSNVLVQKANLKNAQTNLDCCTISAPITGVVIDRRVKVGQTVAASLPAPSLFVIAKDLSQMEVWATVNEVDVGKVRAGQDVRFAVNAFPNRIYHGKVIPQGKLPFRLNATMKQNGVTYTVVVSADNKDGLLRPYLTANLTFIVAEKKDVLLVPGSALCWQPAHEQIAPEIREEYFQRRSKKPSPADPTTMNRGFVWQQGEDGYVRYIEVKTGLSDSDNTEIVGVAAGGELPENVEVITGEGETPRHK